ncbi:MAG: HAD-IA family hydrolase [Sphingomonas taxi]
MTRLALLDCDGTLVDSAANICLAVERTFDRHQLAPPPREAIRGIVGLSLPQAMAVLHPTADADYCDVLAQSYKDAFVAMRGTADFVHEPLYPGIAECLATLADSGWTLGVATGKSDRGLAIILATHGLTSAFVTLQTADRHPSKPHPAMALAAMAEAGSTPDQTVMIGDTSYDMTMGRNAGTHAVGVTWGYHSPAMLTAAGAAEVVGHADDLAPAMLACVEQRSISAA